MSQFAFFAALLALIAVAFAVSALWQRSRRLALAVAVALPLAAAALYHYKGEPLALDPGNVAPPKTIEDATRQLEARLATDPDNLEMQVMLARAYMAMQKFEPARDIYAKAVAARPEDVDLAVEYAESLMRSSAEHRFPPKAVAMLEAAVAKNPDNERALFFLGMQRMQDQQPAEAAKLWERLLPKLSPDAAGVLRQQVNAAREAAGLPPLPEPVAAPALLRIRVQIDPTLARLAQPGDVLYVFVRGNDAANAGPPLAVKRLAPDKLPLELTLSDDDSPMPTGKLSAQTKVLVMARLSHGGNAQAESGDIQADPLPATVGQSEPVTLTLSRVKP